MQSRPAGWPVEGAVEDIPGVFLRLPGSTWPPAMGGAPAGTGACASWSISRDLTGGFLPGQVRGASGFSVATASAQIPQPATPLSPWSAAGSQLTPGGQATLYASHDGADGSTSLQLGKFRVDPIAGASTDPALNLDLIEDSGRLKRPVAIKWAYTTPAGEADQYTMDISWVLDQIARAGGFYATPKPTAETAFSMPLVGGPACEVGTTTRSVIDGYREVDHRIGLTGASSIDAIQSEAGVTSSFYLSANVAGMGGVIRMGDLLFEITPSTVRVRELSTTKAVIGLENNDPVTVQLRITRIAVGLMIQARITDTTWGDIFTVPISGRTPWDGKDVTVSTLSPDGFIGGIRMDAIPDPIVFNQPTAAIDLAGSPIRGMFDQEALSGWDLAQQIAKATMGALWISESGVFTYRSRHTLRGIDQPAETVEALTQLEDLVWRVDPSDVADRVTVTYVPTEVRRAYDSITVWEATNPVRVFANSTKVIYADIEGTTDRLSEFFPLWEGNQQSRFGRWAAAYQPEGGGEQPPDHALSVRAEMVGISRIKITIQNRLSRAVWIVDGNGNPTLTVRTSVHVTPGEPVTVAQGASEDQALAPLDIDCGASVQDNSTAVELCSWVAGQTRTALPTIESVRVKPDLRRQLGDVIRLTDGITELNTKAVIVGISLSGKADGYQQVLSLALLGTTFFDLDQWFVQQNITTFGQWDEWMSSMGITTFSHLDRWLSTLGRFLT